MPTPETLGPKVAHFVLSRAGYGPRPGEIAAALSRGLTPWLEEQLAPPADPELESRLASFPTLGYSISRILALYNADPRSTGVVLDEFMSAKLVRAVHGRNQLQEVLVDFWFNHFNVYVADGFDRYSISSYERDAIRPHVLGRFRDLLGAASLHPAMLFYLDNYLNAVPRRQGNRIVGGLNENQGRELLELHTVGVDAGYTQQDVIEASRCLTGHDIEGLQTVGSYLFRPANHDNDAKQVFGLAIPAGGGETDVQRLFDHLSRHPATARFIARKLAQRFVADDPPAALVERVADVFLRTDGDLQLVMRGLLGSPEFLAEAYGTGKPRTAFEYAVSVLRAADAEVSSGRGTRSALQDMGMPLYACNPPTGYSNRGLDWLNPSSQLYRMNFAIDACAGGVAGATVDVDGLIRSGGGDPADPGSAAAAINREVFGGTLSPLALQTASRLEPAGRVPVSVRVAGLLLASPDMQVR